MIAFCRFKISKFTEKFTWKSTNKVRHNSQEISCRNVLRSVSDSVGSGKSSDDQKLTRNAPVARNTNAATTANRTIISLLNLLGYFHSADLYVNESNKFYIQSAWLNMDAHVSSFFSNVSLVRVFFQLQRNMS